jgi:hypothetical protein
MALLDMEEMHVPSYIHPSATKMQSMGKRGKS